RGPRAKKDNWDKVESLPGNSASEQMRLDAVKAEADRKARQNKVEGGLPAFHEVQPLTGHIDGDKVYFDDPTQHDNSPQGGRSHGGYVQAPAGSRAVDEYYSPTRTDYAPSTYPPTPQNSYGNTGNAAAGTHRQPSSHSQSHYSQSNYAPSTRGPTSPPPVPAAYPQQYSDPYNNSNAQYGHTTGGSSYHTATSSHNRQNTNYSTYDPYDSQHHDATNPYDNYNTAPVAGPSANYAPNPSNYYQAQSPPAGPSHQNQRSYTLGGGTYPGNGYGASSVPPLPEHQTSYFPGQTTLSPPPLVTNVAYAPASQTSPVKGPRPVNSLQVRNEDDSPPTYDAGTSGVQGTWGKHS
ncbi:hypothetical protein H0H87_006478, partial [Tephrocybe sp. NHM501043]